ncbi:MAG TPA: hypothetical protein VNG31_01140 [Candidatus Baltobacteraceae bacterium]|nr:hypothetical protein [Candidatus Baltobacteraceae bacterium]
MNVSRFSRYAISICTASAILAGCGGSQGQFGAPVAAQQRVVMAGHPARAQLGMLHHKSGAGFTVSGRDILHDGHRFFIKGVDYGSTNAGYSYYNAENKLVPSAPVANPLDDAYRGIWQPDLDLMRADGVNAVKVYNVSLKSFEGVPGYGKATFQHPSKGETGKIDEFLDAAWNNGNHPIYVVLSIFFEGAALNDPSLTATYGEFYRLMDKEYGAKPAVMGISISSEINAANYVRSSDWWKAFNTIDAAAKTGFAEAGNTQRITTTTFVDGTISEGGKIVEEAPYFGTKFNSTNDTWGLDIYRGPRLTPTHLWEQIAASTTKPTMLGEYGNPAGWFFRSTAKHSAQWHCIDYSDPGTPEDVKELPDAASANPNMQNLAEYVTGNQKDIFDNFMSSEAVTSGGFYFEFSDEWWKAGWSLKHIGGAGGHIPKNDQYAPCYNSEAWFGLYQDVPVGATYDDHGNLTDQPFPNGRKPDKRVPRQSVVDALSALWKAE